MHRNGDPCESKCLSTHEGRVAEGFQQTIERGDQIVATQYAPFVAISYPIKRHTQEPGLSEIDMLRRLAKVAHAVEQYYTPGMRWLLGIEATVFQGPHFGLPEDYVRRFHERSRYLARLFDPEGKRLQVFDQADLTWVTPERRSQWHAYEQRKLTELRDANYELGFALGRKMKITIIVQKGLTSPYMLRGFGAVAARLKFLPEARIANHA